MRSGTSFSFYCLVTTLFLFTLSACSNDSTDENTIELSDAAQAGRDSFDQLLDSFIDETNVINTMVYVSNGALSGSYSVAKGEAQPGIPMSADHQFHIASMSKPFTATLLLQLIEEGYFTLDSTLFEVLGDATIGELFPGYAFLRTDADGTPVANMTIDDLQRFGGESQGGSITIRQLMQHSHGMPDVTFDAPNGQESLAGTTILKYAGQINPDPAIYPDQWSGFRLLEYYLASGLPLQSFFSPGMGYHYGDTGPVIAALIIERATGLSLAEAYRARIFDPLEMNDTYLHHYEEPRQSRSSGLSHRYFDLTRLLPGGTNVDVDADGWNTSIDWAGGGLVSTAADIERFYHGLFDGSLLQNPSVIGALENRVLADDDTPYYGLGFGLQVSSANDAVLAYEHGGFWGSYMMYIPTSGTTLTYTVNQVEFRRFDELYERARELLVTSN
ncbi:MAG: beta-lactamase family protein [Gammaproteobacteria bacterium]|nr:beta-lactamase family protein [Gammaproteobacteria bacterium]